MVTYAEVDIRTRIAIAKSTHRELAQIMPKFDLESDLGFTMQNKNALSSALNREFEREGLQMTPDETFTCSMVSQIVDVVWKKML